MALAPEARAAVEPLLADLRGVFGDRLRSLVVYGASGGSGRWTPDFHRTLALVDRIDAGDLERCASLSQAWHGRGLATPIFLTPAELDRSLDAFPLEIEAIMSSREVVHGIDPFDGRRIAAADLRRACEVQARSHLLHLRESYIEAEGQAPEIARLIVSSALPFRALLEHFARLRGDDAAAPALARHAEAAGLPAGVVADVLRLTESDELSATDAVRLFPSYLDAVDRLVQFIDRWTP